ncbi:MAG TPA: SDR family oxidoreductase [Flavipsychrobacter sp.]|jgi:NADP-dependent 3-hydroxy acid dehydrogenase YdfG|nr:SDR family oxidoreductase [Flavipsychrobacter sp.]
MKRNTAVITGATQGIGRAIAEKFLKEGWDIAICARSSHDLKSLQLKWQLQYPNARVVAIVTDMEHIDQVLSFAEKVLHEFEAINVLVNNAGLFLPGTLADEPQGLLERLMSINLYSAYHLTRFLLPSMKKNKAGHIFNMCSVASLRAYENGGAYSITKYALQGFSDNLRMELIPDSIKVTSIMPGATWSRSWEGAPIDKSQLMTPEDIATLVWTASQLSPQANVEQIVIRPLKGDI